MKPLPWSSVMPSFALSLLMALAIPAARADSPPDARAEQWRAASRFGYGVALGADAAGLPQGKAWALAELDRAVSDAAQPPAMEPALALLRLPLPELIAKDKADREQRRQNTTDLAPGEKPPKRFAQQVVGQAVTWRLNACSRPDSENPLLARMTEFWFNHLNVSAGKVSVKPLVGSYLIKAIRPHALGRFEDLLLASAKHPAMLHYLDQVRSVAEQSAPPSGMPTNAARPRGLNENYARELMELHTLGVDGGYSQQDVRELARILTGWTVGPQSPDGFRFVQRLHDTGEKTFLGQRFVAGGGVEEGERAIRLLARQPATAQRIALRLAQWFVGDNPPPALVASLSQRYLETQGDIAAVMRTLIESPETWNPQNQLFKTPIDYACSVLTAVGGPDDPRLLRQAAGFLSVAGQALLAWPTPDGYKTDAATWLSPEALSRRADFALGAARLLPNAESLAPWLPTEQWARIQREPLAQQAGLALASPAFMRK
jgi:uncharacterized protein (DUF1800 family)